MFEIDIRTKVREGVMLHRRDGTPYWKLSLTCSRDGCDKEVDMGECMCFDSKEKMEKCRDTHTTTCSTKCWYEATTRENIDKILADIKRHNEHCLATGDGDMVLFADDELELIDDYFDAIAGDYDGCDFWETYEIDECPV